MQDTSKVEQLKKLAAEALTAGNTEEAINQYSLAIDLDPTNHVLWSNRSAAHAKATQWDMALSDAEKTLELKPDWFRGYSRKGAALHGMGKFDESISTYNEGLKLDPENAQLKQAVIDAQNARSQPQSQFDFTSLFREFFQGDVIGKMAMMPEMVPYLGDPEFVSKVNQIKADPSLLVHHLKDKRISTYISHVIQGGGFGGGSAGPSSSTPMDSSPEYNRAAPEMPKQDSAQKPKEPELSQEEQQALDFKQKGNEAYAARDFAKALEFYEKALELQPENIAFLLNRSAVYFEQGDYDTCIKACHEIIELGRSVRADFKLIARALGRIGNAYAKLNRYPEAIEYYNRSLTEHRDASVLTALRNIEKKKIEEEQANYISPELSQKAKEQGNEHFKEGRYPEAIKCYHEAIKRDPSNPLLLTNRAAAYSKLGEYPSVIKDCDSALAIDPKLIKAYIRKGQTYHVMQDYTKAMETFDQGLRIDPKNMELANLLNRTVMAMQSTNTGNSNPEEVMAKAMQNPQVREILEDPAMQQILQQMSTNPQAARDHLRNPEIARRINVLRAHGIVG